MRYSILYSISYLLLFVWVSYSANPTFYLSSSSQCVGECGSEKQPFANFQDAITTLSTFKSGDLPTPILMVDRGDYYGDKNNEIIIDFDLEIRGLYEQDRTVIDCQSSTFAFKATGSTNKLTIKGIMIQNCIAPKGGAIYTDNRYTVLENVIFYSNNAMEGSSIYSQAEYLTIDSCMFVANQGLSSIVEIDKSTTNIMNSRFVNNSDGIMDLVCGDAADVYLEQGSVFKSTCNTDCRVYSIEQELCGATPSASDLEASLCNYDKKCDSLIENHINCAFDCVDAKIQCNNNGFCDAGETFKTCPSDCNSMLRPGWKLETYNYDITKPKHAYTNYTGVSSIEYLRAPSLLDFMGKTYPPLSAKLSSKISITETKDYYFQLRVSNLAAIVFLDGRVLFDSFFPQDNTGSMLIERKLLLSSERAHFIEVYFTVNNDFQRDLELMWKFDLNEQYTLIPSAFITLTETLTCGDGVCNEEPTTCIIDCHDQIEKDCSPTSPPPPLQEYYYPIQDTVGTLLNTQYLSTLPGLKYMSQGINLETGKSLPSAIFAYTYCDDYFSLAHFHYRDTVYTIPKGLHAQIAPRCTMDSTTSVFGTSDSKATNDAEEWGLDVNAAGGGSAPFVFSAKVSSAFKMSESTKKASDTQAKTNNILFNTKVACEVYKVNVDEPYRWSPRFIQDIGSAYEEQEGDTDQQIRKKTVANMVRVIEKYGAAYYKSATFGGQIDQSTIVNSEFASDLTSEELGKSVESTVAASLSVKVYPVKVNAKYSYSSTSKKENSKMASFEKNSKRTTATVLGGAPGSYGEEDANAFETWASTVDQLPYPISGKMAFLSDILPRSWYFKGSLSVRDAWLDAEELYYKGRVGIADLIYVTKEDIDALEPDQTFYLLEGKDCFIDFTSQMMIDISIANETGPESYQLVKYLSNGAWTLLRIKHNDDQGVAHIKFYNSNGAVYPCGNTMEATLTNLVTSRSYHLMKNTQIGGYSIASLVENRILIRFQSYFLTKDCYGCGVQITVIGSNGRASTIVDNRSLMTDYQHLQTSMEFEINAKNYIGQVIGLELSIATVAYSGEPDQSYYFSFDFDNIKVFQSCPNDQHSKCVPTNILQNTPFDRIGMTKAYDTRTYSFYGSPFISVKFSDAIRKVYFPLDLIRL
ncbi:hypothetical protein CYY_003803 [Polysphondylium violaceum]|uniref:MACPF domain-containing protein n=1 Tax=Polysphondylium violaceum TaxID=133409 RepID=A0A8J4PXW8_9MYCE|nr:hypothetical protein CYY_003803 [Polysphondylium violaceum]